MSREIEDSTTIIQCCVKMGRSKDNSVLKSGGLPRNQEQSTRF